MSLPTEATVLRWGATVAFIACFGGALYMLGVSAAPWVALLLGALVFAVIMGRLWSTHLDAAEAARSRAEGQNVRRFQAREDTDTTRFRPAEEPAPPQSSAAASYYDDEDDD